MRWFGQREWSGGIFVGVTLTDLAHTLFLFIRRSQALLGVLGSACDCRMKNRPDPAKIGLLGARLGNFCPYGNKIRLGKGMVGSRVEMLSPFPTLYFVCELHHVHRRVLNMHRRQHRYNAIRGVVTHCEINTRLS
jgi:hypothetical protein